MSRATDIADAVVAQINGQTWSVPFKATREYVPVWRLDKVPDLTCAVVPANPSATGQHRRLLLWDYPIDVGFIRQLPEGTKSDADKLMTVVEDVIDFMERKQVTAGSITATCTGVRYKPLYSPQHFDSHNTFLSIVQFNFRAPR